MSIRPFFEVSIELEGFKRPTDKKQPEVIDQKTGKPYDLTDPDLPVVTSPSFTVHYWLMPKTPAFIDKYLKERYDFFNKTRFQGKLRQPTLKLVTRGKDAFDLKTRGLWSSGINTISISIHLFKAPHEGWVNNTLIHEMCHQYVSVFEGGESELKGHGPKWQAAMRRAGLTPSQYDYTPNEMYMTEREKRKVKIQLQQRQAYLDAYNKLKATHQLVKAPKPGTKVVFLDGNGGVHYGVLVKKSPSGKWTVFENVNEKLTYEYEGLSPLVLFLAQ